jgi:hypothetical protein
MSSFGFAAKTPRTPREMFLLSAEKAESKKRSFHLPAPLRTMKNFLPAISAPYACHGKA